MKGNKFWLFISTVVVFSMLLVGCGSTAQPTTVATQPPATNPPATVPTQPSAKAPTELHIAIGMHALDEAWTTGLLQSLDRIIAQKPHGLAISYDLTENVDDADAQRVFGQLAATGKYQIIWAHSTYSDAIKPLMVQYPEIVWICAGTGNEALGKNMYYVEMTGYDSAYLIGMLAGLLTKTNNIGTVAEYPDPIQNSLINAYMEGAKAVNPTVKVQFAFIESWYDPPKAAEVAKAQFANGADLFFSQPIGPIEACKSEHKWCFGSYVDQYDLGPDVVLTSDVIRWDPHWTVVIDAWWNHVVNGTPYNAPTSPVLFTLQQGGEDLAPFHGHENDIPADVMKKVMDARQSMLDGTLVVQYNPNAPQE